MTENPHRLPRAALPTRYDLELVPDLAAATFRGTVEVTLVVAEPVVELVCNALELDVDTAVVTGPDGSAVEGAITLDAGTERLHVRLPAPAAPGEHRLRLTFQGILNDKLRGWYRSTFTGADGTPQVIATSQMQATDCRRAFPCWDEPDFKAVFGVTLVVADDLLAVSNGPEIAREPAGDGLVRVRFADTMPMSTYLIAFVVGPLVATEPVDVDGVPLRVVHVPGKEHLTGFGLEIGAFALRWFQDYYGIPYPGEKVDLVALPDFAAGAMENLGCITFRENLLLVEPATSTQQEEQVVADVVAHEVAHMWFGDLVTMRWWNGIWLNEAFATFMEVACCNAFRPSWNRWTSFSLERSAAFEVDGLVSTRPVEYEVVSPEDADGMFDVLTYEKGGALLRMLEQYLGADRFRDGIRHYLRAHSYANTETGDLWDAIELVTGEPVRRIMDTWIWQGGYPLVTAMVHGDELVLSQQRFLFDGDDDGTRWAIPLQVRLLTGAGEQTERVLLDGDEVRLRLDDPSAVVVVNAGAHAFLRVHYTDELLGRLTGHALARLSTPERYALVDDAWSSVVAGRTGADAFVHFARGFADEPELQVWQVLLNGLRWCDRFLAGTNREHFQAYVRALVGPALARLGWEVPEGADPLAGELRATLIRALAVLGADPSAQARAREVHSSPGDYDPAVAAAALQVVAATGGEAEYEAFVEGFRTAPTPQESLRYLYALGDFPDAELVRRTCELCLSGEVKTQNAPFLLARCILHRDHGELAWRFVREHWDEANTRFPSNTIVRMVDPVKTLTTPAQQADVAGFFAEHGIPQAAKTLEQVLERQRVNVALRARATGPLEDEFS